MLEHSDPQIITSADDEGCVIIVGLLVCVLLWFSFVCLIAASWTKQHINGFWLTLQNSWDIIQGIIDFLRWECSGSPSISRILWIVCVGFFFFFFFWGGGGGCFVLFCFRGVGWDVITWLFHAWLDYSAPQARKLGLPLGSTNLYSIFQRPWLMPLN